MFCRALSALNNAYLGNVMGTSVVSHRDSNTSALYERVSLPFNNIILWSGICHILLSIQRERD